ncbi:lipopolysaccharide biosynthesis protein [Intestinicryptomonas porci]|uniref:Lipopolysaccharide biosynthesis protein n=1 Tax=Intestinicryptomonas porci TaxID=2926320 RepID=A0ABU4WGW2_9BACT|nr:hypothetical protein [Opitutales bacterium CLA-KB-P66]
MAISLYASRIILLQLRVDNFGIYNVVGGVVAMFSVISSALSSSISRFITFELGRQDFKRMGAIFSTSVNIQIFLAIVILLLGESIGSWFLNCKMTIPPERLYAANWVLQCSLLTFCVNLISVPYVACIVAHERMTAFAYITILDAVLRLAACLSLAFAPFDKLIFYSLLMLLAAVFIRFIYGFYCSGNFAECKYRFIKDTSIVKEMASFAGWNFFTSAAYIFNIQGISILINIFFGVAFNAARGIAMQVEGAVTQFVGNFTIAINPQITKNYAAGEIAKMFALICRGAKFSYFLLLIMAVPLIIETETVLSLWLKIVPEDSVIFVRLSLVGAMVNILGNTGYTACMATGNIKKYVIYITSVGLFVFPLSWMAFAQGMPAYSAYVIYILVYIAVNATRLYIMKGLLNFPIKLFLKEVLTPVALTTIAGCIVPAMLAGAMQPNVTRLFATIAASVVSVGLATCFLGLTKHERQMTIGKIFHKIKTIVRWA